jgi:hypothetical protein
VGRCGSRRFVIGRQYGPLLVADEPSTPLENADVVFVPRTALTPFIPQEQIYPPILRALEANA